MVDLKQEKNKLNEILWRCYLASTLNTSLQETLTKALQKEGYKSLKSFYERHTFSFSYEYMRQIFLGVRVPQTRKVQELAKALEIEESALQKTASQNKLALKIRHHYKLPPQAKLGRISEKIKGYRKENQKEEKLFRWIQQLGDSEKDQIFDYVQFLRQQWRRKQHKPKKTNLQNSD